MTNIGTRLKKEREKLKLNQDDFANEVGVSRVSISNYERNLKSPSFENLQAMLLVGVDIFYVLTGVHAPPDYLSQARHSLLGNESLPDNQELLKQLKGIIGRLENLDKSQR